MNPTRVSCEDGKGLARPETVGLAPDGDIRVELSHVLGKSLQVDFPVRSAANIKVLLEDAGPLVAADVSIDMTHGLGTFKGGKVHLVGKVDVGLQLLVSLVVLVVEGTSFILNDTSESVKIGRGSGSSDFSAETVTSNGSHGDLVLVHPSDDIARQVL